MLRDSTVAAVVAVVHTRPRAIRLPLITMRKSIPGFLFPYMGMGLHLSSAITEHKTHHLYSLIITLYVMTLCYTLCNMNYFIYISHDLTAREEMNSIN